MLKILLIIAALVVGLPLVGFLIKLIFGIVGLTLGLISLPLLIVGLILILSFVLIFGLLKFFLPLLIVGGLGFLAYKYIKNRQYF